MPCLPAPFPLPGRLDRRARPLDWADRALRASISRAPPRSLPNGRHAVKSAHYSMMKPASPYLQTPRFHTTVQTLKGPVSTIASNQPKPCPCVDAPMYISRTSRYSPALYFMRTTTSARLSC